MGANRQIWAPAGLVKIAAGGAGPAPLGSDGTIHRPEPFLLIAIQVLGARIAGLHTRFHHRMEQRIIILLRRGDAHRAIAAVIVIRADVAGFRFTVVGQAVEIAPALQAWRGGPVVEVHCITADVAHAVNQRRAAETFATAALHAAVIHIRLRFGLVGPVIASAL